MESDNPIPKRSGPRGPTSSSSRCPYKGTAPISENGPSKTGVCLESCPCLIFPSLGWMICLCLKILYSVLESGRGGHDRISRRMKVPCLDERMRSCGPSYSWIGGMEVSGISWRKKPKQLPMLTLVGFSPSRYLQMLRPGSSSSQQTPAGGHCQRACPEKAKMTKAPFSGSLTGTMEGPWQNAPSCGDEGMQTSRRTDS